jgi:hypothetical protein
MNGIRNGGRQEQRSGTMTRRILPISILIAAMATPAFAHTGIGDTSGILAGSGLALGRLLLARDKLVKVPR